MFRRTLLVLLQPPDDACLIIRIQERSLIREVMNHPEAENANNYSGQTFENEDPRPSLLIANAIHQSNSGCQQPAKGSADRCCREENGSPDTEFVALIPTTQIVVDPRKQPSFRKPQPPPRSHHALEIMRQPHRGHHNPPKHHNNRYEDTRPQPLEQDIGEGFKERVGDEENGETGIVLATCDLEGLLETVETRIADVGAVEEGDQVEQAEPGD